MKTRRMLPLIAIAALATTGCVTNTEGPQQEAADVSAIAVDETAAALVPQDVRDAGTIVVGTDAAYPPNEYRDSDGEIVGWGVDLVEAIGAKLGLEVEWQVAGFDSLIPNVQGGRMDMGASSFTDNAEREEVVDFVNYYTAGSLWAAPVGAEVDPEDACGHSVAVQQGTYQHTDELPARNEACIAAGKPEIEVLPFDTQASVTNAVVQGQAEAFSADSPVTLSAIDALSDKLVESGEVFDVAPYGYALPKDSELTEAVRAAVQSLMDDGTYLEILSAAGVEAGAIEAATINAATTGE